METFLGNLSVRGGEGALPKMRNRFRAETVRKMTGVVLTSFYDEWTGCGELFCASLEEGAGKEEVERPLYRWQDGSLVRVPSFLPAEWQRMDYWSRGVYYRDLGQGRVVAVGWDCVQEGSYRHVYDVGIVADSAGLLKCPLYFELDGQRLQGRDIYAMPDGGVLIWYLPCGQRDFYELVRYAPGGPILWRRQVEAGEVYPLFLRDGLLWFLDRGRADRYYAVDENGDETCHLELPPPPDDKGYVYSDVLLWEQPVADELWVERIQLKRRGRKRAYTLLRLDTRGRLLGQHAMPCEISGFPGLPTRNVALWPGRVCLASLDEGIWMLDATDLSVLASVKECRGYSCVTFDGRGRVWVDVDGAWECYDQDLNLLSRHWIKGSATQMMPQSGEDGALRLLTYDHKTKTLRIYAMKEK